MTLYFKNVIKNFRPSLEVVGSVLLCLFFLATDFLYVVREKKTLAKNVFPLATLL